MRKSKSLKLLMLLMLTLTVGFAQQNKNVSRVHFDKEKWVEYIEGNMPLIISVPHGGRVTVDSLPVRNCKGAVTGVDGYTIEMARAIHDYLKETYNLVPHIIISHIGRRHVDQNRELENGATCGHKESEKAWYTFHNWVDSALNLATIKGKERAMYIDLHRHGHKKQRLEIGYNLDGANLRDILADNFNEKSKYHSLTNLLKMEKSLNFKEMIFGDNSFGTFLQNNGVPAIPSKQDLAPATGELFFAGGDNTRRFTGEKYPNVFGLQIECDIASTVGARRGEVAKGISESAMKYMNMYAKTKYKPVKK